MAKETITTQASDAELIGWSVWGDAAAFVELVKRHEEAVWAYLVRRAGRQAAEDLLGEVWVAAYAGRGSYDPAFAEARPWLFGVALNVLRRYWRSRPAELSRADLSEVVDGPVLSDPWSGEDERIHGEAVLRRVLAHLPDKERGVLFLVVWEQLSAADAARVLGIPAGTARRYLHQARTALRSAPAVVAVLDQWNAVKETR